MHERMAAQLTRNELRALLDTVVTNRGGVAPSGESVDLRDIGFRSLDFSELALRVEDEIGRELNFDAVGLRAILTVGDVLDLIETLQAQ